MTKPVFCEACGTVNETATEQVATLQEAVTNLGLEVSRKQSRVNALRREQAEARPPEYDQAIEVAEFWRENLSPRARELNGPRLEKVIARLRAGYTVEELKHSLWGYRCRPNLKEGRRVREGGKRYVDLELLMRDEKHVQIGIEIAEQESRFDQNVLDSSGSRHAAVLCDCGHARWAHGLLWLQQHEACYEEGCLCTGYDTFDSLLAPPPPSDRPNIPTRREPAWPQESLDVETRVP